MKVRLHKTGKILDTDDASAQWLVSNGYAEAIPETKKTAADPADTEEATPPAPRRGRPPKAR